MWTYNYWNEKYSPKLAENKLQASRAYNYTPTNEYLLPENFLNPYQQDKFYLQSKANEQIFKNFKIKIDVFGDSRISSGDVIKLVFPEITPPEGNRGPEEDKHYSGNWLIVAIKHTFLKPSSCDNVRYKSPELLLWYQRYISYHVDWDDFDLPLDKL